MQRLAGWIAGGLVTIGLWMPVAGAQDVRPMQPSARHDWPGAAQDRQDTSRSHDIPWLERRGGNQAMRVPAQEPHQQGRTGWQNVPSGWRHDSRQDRADLRRDRWAVQYDRYQLWQDRRAGNRETFLADRDALRRDRAALRHDRHDLWRDWHEMRHYRSGRW